MFLLYGRIDQPVEILIEQRNNTYLTSKNMSLSHDTPDADANVSFCSSFVIDIRYLLTSLPGQIFRASRSTNFAPKIHSFCFSNFLSQQIHLAGVGIKTNNRNERILFLRFAPAFFCLPIYQITQRWGASIKPIKNKYTCGGFSRISGSPRTRHRILNIECLATCKSIATRRRNESGFQCGICSNNDPGM